MIEGYARAAVLVEHGADLEIRLLPLPSPEAGALLVRVLAATVCGSDVHLWHGDGHPPLKLPVILGHEIVGEVVEFGAGLHVDSVGSSLRIGDRVIWTHEPCGRCHGCNILREPMLCSNLRLGLKQPLDEFPYLAAGFAEYSYVWPRAGRVRVPAGVKDSWAAAASCALRTVLHGFDRVGQIDGRHTVVIQGCGPLGLFATAVAATRSPRAVIVIGAPRENLQLAMKWGATDTIAIEDHPETRDRVSRVQSLTAGRGADVVVEVSGAPDAFMEGVEMSARGGRYVVIGPTGGEARPARAALIVQRQLTILGVLGASVGYYAAALDFIRQHESRFAWDDMFGQEYPLEEATTALRRMADRSELKPVIIPAQSRPA